MTTNDSAARKATPIYSGVLRYFPDALAAVARLSKAGNDKHNPGQPLHWSRDKSTDHGDCIVRHQLEPEKLDPETGELHAASVAWRALAQLQLLEEVRTLEALSGPYGKATASFVAAFDGDVWKPGTGRMPCWAALTSLVEVRFSPDDLHPSTRVAHELSWHPSMEYRRAR